MKKQYSIICISLFLFLGFPSITYAADCNKYQCIKCVYSNDKHEVTYTLKSNGDANLGFFDVSYEKLKEDDKTVYNYSTTASYNSFVNSENTKLVCPSTLYSSLSKANENSLIASVEFGFKSNVLLPNTMALNNAKSTDNQKPYAEKKEVSSSTPSEKNPTTPEVEETDWGSVNDTNLTEICAKPELRKPLKFIGTIINLLKIAIPVLIIAFGIMDLYKAITSSKNDTINSSVKSIAIRLLGGVAIFLLPGIVQMILNWVNEWSNYSNTWCCCTQCILDADNCDVNSCSSESCKIGGMN